jgi:hypothetical protein
MDLEKFMQLPVTLVNGDIPGRHFAVEFVRLNGRLYVNDQQIILEMARHKTELTLAYSHDDQQVLNKLTIVDGTHPRLRDRFQDKYGHNGEDFISLEPIGEEI